MVRRITMIAFVAGFLAVLAGCGDGDKRPKVDPNVAAPKGGPSSESGAPPVPPPPPPPK